MNVHAEATKDADQAAAGGAKNGLNHLVANLPASVYGFYATSGKGRVVQYFNSFDSSLSEMTDALLGVTVKEAVRRSENAMATTLSRHGIKSPNSRAVLTDLGVRYEVEVTARALALPDEWGKTFHQRLDAHYLRFKERTISQLGSVDRLVSEAESHIPRLSRDIDRESLKRVMRQIEGARSVMEYSSPARNNFDRATRVIRKWAGNNPGEPIPSRLIEGLRSSIDMGWRMSLQAGLQRSIEIFRDNVISLVRNFSNRVFQGATLYFSEGFRDRGVRAVKWNLSLAHRVLDMCDVYATEDMGLGEGVYYLGYAPFPAHINCLCFLTPVFGNAALPPRGIQHELNILIERGHDANP